MATFALKISQKGNNLDLHFLGELSLYSISHFETLLKDVSLKNIQTVSLNLDDVTYLDTAVAIYINKIIENYSNLSIKTSIISLNDEILSTINLPKKYTNKKEENTQKESLSIMQKIGKYTHAHYIGLLSFMEFLGRLFATKLFYLKSVKNIRYKEIAFEINESGVNALGIIALTSFLIGLVVAYQSAFQLKLYGANIFIVDMLGISMLRELAPLITAIVIAGRSGSAFTAQIGAMKITEELDAMRTMGFDPYIFLVIPRILALMIVMPILIFVADIMGIIGGMVVANLDLKITTDLFLERFTEVVAAKHFFIGLIKGPFFAFLIASIAIYRGLMVKDDTQSIGVNTTKSVVESIFAVIVCDAIFSILFTNLGI